jgi:hypothetical protein
VDHPRTAALYQHTTATQKEVLARRHAEVEEDRREGVWEGEAAEQARRGVFFSLWSSRVGPLHYRDFFKLAVFKGFTSVYPERTALRRHGGVPG